MYQIGDVIAYQDGHLQVMYITESGSYYCRFVKEDKILYFGLRAEHLIGYELSDFTPSPIREEMTTPKYKVGDQFEWEDFGIVEIFYRSPERADNTNPSDYAYLIKVTRENGEEGFLGFLESGFKHMKKIKKRKAKIS